MTIYKHQPKTLIMNLLQCTRNKHYPWRLDATRSWYSAMVEVVSWPAAVRICSLYRRRNT